MKKFHIFYKITYSIDGRYYYGSHSGRLDDNYRGSNKIIHQIIRKHGIEFLIRENLKTFDTREECLAFEDRFLKLFNLKDDPNSFNFKNSAKGGDTWSHMSDDEKSKRKQNLSLKISGKANGNYGKPMSDSAKQKMINSKTGVPIHTDEHKKKTSERVKQEWISGLRSKPFGGKYDNRKGKKNTEDWNANISLGVKNSEKYKKGLSLRSEKIKENTNRILLDVKNDIENGMADFEILEKYGIKSITLYTWKKKIKERNI